MSAHPLTRFVYETFGQQFGDLILAGYGAEPGGGQKKLSLTEADEGTETHWVIEVVASRHPSGDEPLVLAALLKLLLSRRVISQPLEFGLGKLLAELRWPDSSDTRRQAEDALVSYVGLLYDKRPDRRAGRHAQTTSEGACYHLLTGYVRGAESGAGESPAEGRGVYFDDGFIRRLKEGRVYFAGINLGPLYRKSNSDGA